VCPWPTFERSPEIQADSMAPTSFATVMLVIAASVALLLALVGVLQCGDIAVRENQRGRHPHGSWRADWRRSHVYFLRHGLVLTLAGIVLGPAAATLLTPVMSSLLYGVGPTDSSDGIRRYRWLLLRQLVGDISSGSPRVSCQPIIALRSKM
jgi:hypothetical protein